MTAAAGARRALVVGLTGGLASGKSTVARLFERLGVPVVDADVVAREVVEPGEPALEAIRERFGADVVAPDGRLDRARLRERVFADDRARRDLEALLHPRIRARMRERLARVAAPYAISVVPLLLETGQDRDVDRVLVVDTSAEQQIARAEARDGGSRATLQGILDAQVDRATRLARADDVIHNDGSLSELRAEVERLHERYLALAARLRGSAHE